MPTRLEYLAQKALDAHREQEQGEKTDPALLRDAQAILDGSPLKDWFGPVAWAILDHNLHLPHRQQDHVVVEDEDQGEALVHVRLLIARDGGPIGPQYGVSCIAPDNDGPDWTYHARTVHNAVDVGLWVEEQRHRQAAQRASESPIRSATWPGAVSMRDVVLDDEPAS